MLLYGGFGLLAAGIITWLFSDKLSKDADKAAKMKKPAPMIAIVGAAMLVARTLIG